MTKLRASLSVSLDGYGAGPEQSVENPLGKGGEDLHNWFVSTKTFQSIHGKDGGSDGVDDQIAARSFAKIGAWVMGRNMFGPVRGSWPDNSWKGWWGDNPPYHVPVFVLTHYPREPVHMEGGTTFHFVTDGIESALERARGAAGDNDVFVGGGVATIRQYLEMGQMDELHLAIAPILLGGGEALFTGLNLPALGYRITNKLEGQGATHLFVGRQE